MAQHVSYIFQTPSILHCPHDEVFWAVYVFGRCSLEKPLQGPLNRSSNHQVMLSDVLPAIKGSCVHHCNFLAQYLTCFTKWYHKAKKSSCNNSNFSLNTVFFFQQNSIIMHHRKAPWVMKDMKSASSKYGAAQISIPIISHRVCTSALKPKAWIFMQPFMLSWKM